MRLATPLLVVVLASSSVIVAVSGCGAKTSTSSFAASSGQPNCIASGHKNVTINGINYELSWPVDATEVIKAGQLEAAQKGFTFANDQYKLEVVNGRIRLNGKEYGSINRGDRVKLTEGGVLSVNGEERKPQ